MEPFLCLARAAQRAGHEVRLLVPDSAEIDTRGLDAVSLGISFADLAENLGGGGMASMRAFRERIRPAMARALRAAAEVAVEWQPQVILAHPKVLTAPVAAARLEVPWFAAELTPTLTPTGEFPAAGVAAGSLGPWLNRLSYRAVGLAGAMFGSDIRAARQRFGITAGRLPPPVATLAAFSPTLVPRPADWPDSTRLTGDWHGPSSQGELEHSVKEFLADPRRFVYAGFGSMSGGDPVARAEAILAGARSLDLRVLFATGWGGLEPPAHVADAADVLVVDSVPHGAVLPLAAVAVHHGGAGTVHAATRAGTPSVLVPFLGDQPFWAAQLQRIGLAGPPLRREHLKTADATAAIAAAIGHAGRVQLAAAEMSSEHGTDAALRYLLNAA
ncbi:MAG: glycosyltransferase family 1 protein [Propionibacteriaceae bacterium]|nr:glycosyltransferase family 1 protein [Propionibacteriaceae bacterium]